MVKKIGLTQDKFALVDDEDFEYLNQWKWHAHKDGNSFYARRTATLGYKPDGKRIRKTVRMHRLITDVPNNLEVDHKDGNGLNNCKSNLRICSRRQNQQNKIHIKKSSKYPGVFWDKSKNKWVASIGINGKYKILKCSNSEKKCAMAYEKACREMIGEELICKEKKQ